MDGKTFFPQAIDVAEAQKQIAAANDAGSETASLRNVKNRKAKSGSFRNEPLSYGNADRKKEFFRSQNC